MLPRAPRPGIRLDDSVSSTLNALVDEAVVAREAWPPAEQVTRYRDSVAKIVRTFQDMLHLDDARQQIINDVNGLTLDALYDAESACRAHLGYAMRAYEASGVVRSIVVETDLHKLARWGAAHLDAKYGDEA